MKTTPAPARLPVPLHRTARFFEPLEARRMLHGSVAELIDLGVPPAMITEGHISKADFATLPKKVQAHIDGHMIEGNAATDRVDWDAVLGLPLHPEGPPAQGPDSPEVDALPDFFPQIMGSPFLDTTTQTGRNLLRFGTQVNNQGTGPGSLISNNPGGSIPTGAPITAWVNPDGTQNVLQPVYTYTGSSFVLSHYRLAGTMTYHQGHGHFHYDDYAEYNLRHRNANGTPGDYVTRADGTVVGGKVGFCLLTFSGTFTTEAGQNSSTLPGFNQDGNAPASCGFGQGIRVGRYDQYTSSLEGQWIDVTGVSNGQYFVEIKLDAQNTMAETNDNNNAKSFAFTLNAGTPGGAITPDEYDLGDASNDTFDTATDFGELGVFTKTGLNIHQGPDQDWFEWAATSTGTGTVTSAGSGDVNLYLYDDAGNLLKQSTNTGASESISWNFTAGEEYYLRAGTYNSTVSGNYQIAWNIKPTINAAATDPVGNELGGNSAVVGVARNGPVTTPLTVNFTVGGTATRGADYELYHDGVLVAGNTLTIGNLAPVGALEVRPIYDSTPEAPESVIITLGTAAAYVVGAGGGSATVHIGDAGPEVVQTTQTWQVSPHKLVFNIDRALASTVDGADFLVWNLDTNQPVNPQAFNVAQTGENATVTLTFDGVLPDGRYRATLTGAGVTNALGDPMFGDFVHNFFVLTGDANHDGRINLDDFNILAANFGQSGRDGSTGDFTYDGIANLNDFNVLASKFGTVIAGASTSASPFGTGRQVDGDDDETSGLDELA